VLSLVSYEALLSHMVSFDPSNLQREETYPIYRVG
jgi:hypothetical protein